MPAKWKEVSAYTGQPVEEDAPTNAVAHGQVALPPDALNWTPKLAPSVAGWMFINFIIYSL